LLIILIKKIMGSFVMIRELIAFYKRLFPFIARSRKFGIISIICALIFVGIDIGMAFFLQKIIDLALNKFYMQVALFATVACLTIILGFAINSMSIINSGKFAAYTLEELRNRIFRHLADISLPYLEQAKKGELTSRLFEACNTLHQFLKEELPSYVHQYVRAILALVILSIINIKLLLAGLIAVPVAIFISNKLSKAIGTYARSEQEEHGKSNAILLESLSGSEIIKSFNIFDHIYQRYKTAILKSVYYAKKVLFIESSIIPAAVSLGLAPLLICSIYGGYLTLNHEITLGQLIAFIQLQNYINETLKALPDFTSNVRRVTGATQIIFDNLDIRAEEQGGDTTTPSSSKAIEFCNVSFGYQSEEPVLRDICLTVEAGKTVAVVGPSGSGKSTLIKLICGQYQPTEGTVAVYGRDLKNWNIESLRGLIALVAQDPHMFPGSIEQNISCTEYTDSRKLAQAVELADLDEFISVLPDSTGSSVGERGNRLSGGQQQKVAIARSIYKDAPILLMDEATSALDANSERKILKSLQEKLGEKSMLFVTHRLSAMEHADLILVMDNGRIVQMGTHQDLLRVEGLYQELNKIQSRSNRLAIKEVTD
jgi:ABC-type multidrug transport system fused ATPase/permease subunit